ncbi:hypothetical protein Kpol_431p2 [Vanderwaltozyma polyspora DSM 70294]|uniref:Uncharacterized protein n=1 Tax=Vanderwaltozyma polyspora (strain ATCC 22028 / DSM 70294 / BCRC 21397 / CBS 2163 / NBRC 10782 / NRRL Y-8283 / UCD 57-17) TaxID=436907 RepID=A7TRM3_VANPO|nr:uncharacterized protein Kpol_431p2 [Vanderwaltozyma polyspora DSM 70294]EDO15075.1 hypothetical protein Kpol_431p2 [Vanderwaltozyma polyspora DSM 70294]
MPATDYLIKAGNQAIRVNPPNGVDFHITNRGSDWLFSAFCLFAFFCIILVVFMFRKPANERLFYYTGIAPSLVMAIAYFTMASNLGWAPVRAEFNHVRTSTQEEHPGYRQIFYARYVGWFLAFPWPIIQACLLGNTPVWQICFNIAMTEVFTIGFLVASVVHSTYKWGYFVFGIAGALVASISVLTTTRNLVKPIGRDVWLIFNCYYGAFMFLWFIYPVAFGISDGGNVLQPDSSSVFHGILDVLALGVMPALFVPIAYNIGLDRLGLRGYDEGIGGMFHEKSVSGISSMRNSGETAVSSPKSPASPVSSGTPVEKKKKKSKKSKKAKKTSE